jgi:hypothetical protein
MENLVASLIDSGVYQWVSRAIIIAAKNAGIPVEGLEHDQLLANLEKVEVIPFREQIADTVKEEAEKVVKRVWDTMSAHLQTALIDTTVEPNRLLETIKPLIDDVPQKVRNRVANNALVSRAINRDEL